MHTIWPIAVIIGLYGLGLLAVIIAGQIIGG
jgi:hypothetical protein